MNPIKYYQNKSNTFKASIAYIIASLISKGISFISIPIFTRLMSPDQMGVVTNFNSWQSVLAVFVGLALNSGSFNIAMMEYKADRDGYVFSILKLSTLSALVFVIIVLTFHRFFVSFFSLSIELLFVMGISFVIQPSIDFWLGRNRYEYKYKNVFAYTTVSALFGLLIPFLFVYLSKKNGVEETGSIKIISTVAVSAVFGFILYVIQYKKGFKGSKKNYWRYALGLSLPLILHSAGKHILDSSDKLMITKMVGLSEAGIYGVIHNIGSIAMILWLAINSALVPTIFEVLECEEKRVSNVYKTALKSTIHYLVSIFLVGTIAVSLLAPEIIKIIATADYYVAIPLVPAISAGVFFTAIYNLFGNVLLYYKKTKTIMIATLFAAGVNIVMNYIFIKTFGYIAAAYTTLASYICLAIFQYVAMRHNYSGELINGRIIVFLSVLDLIGCLLSLIAYRHLMLRYVVLALLLLVVAYFLYKYFKTRKERESI